MGDKDWTYMDDSDPASFEPFEPQAPWPFPEWDRPVKPPAPEPCGPFVCEFPDPGQFRWLERWTCPSCRTTYVRAMKKGHRAPRGHWVLPLLGRR